MSSSISVVALVMMLTCYSAAHEGHAVLAGDALDEVTECMDFPGSSECCSGKCHHHSNLIAEESVTTPPPERVAEPMFENFRVVEVYENIRMLGKLFSDRPPWSNRDGTKPMPKDLLIPDSGWIWLDNWTWTGGDADGWEYAADFPFEYSNVKSSFSMVKRRKWIRTTRQRIPLWEDELMDSLRQLGSPLSHPSTCPVEVENMTFLGGPISVQRSEGAQISVSLRRIPTEPALCPYTFLGVIMTCQSGDDPHNPSNDSSALIGASQRMTLKCRGKNRRQRCRIIFMSLDLCVSVLTGHSLVKFVPCMLHEPRQHFHYRHQRLESRSFPGQCLSVSANNVPEHHFPPVRLQLDACGPRAHNWEAEQSDGKPSLRFVSWGAAMHRCLGVIVAPHGTCASESGLCTHELTSALGTYFGASHVNISSLEANVPQTVIMNLQVGGQRSVDDISHSYLFHFGPQNFSLVPSAMPRATKGTKEQISICPELAPFVNDIDEGVIPPSGSLWDIISSALVGEAEFFRVVHDYFDPITMNTPRLLLLADSITPNFDALARTIKDIHPRWDINHVAIDTTQLLVSLGAAELESYVEGWMTGMWPWSYTMADFLNQRETTTSLHSKQSLSDYKQFLATQEVSRASRRPTSVFLFVSWLALFSPDGGSDGGSDGPQRTASMELVKKVLLAAKATRQHPTVVLMDMPGTNSSTTTLWKRLTQEWELRYFLESNQLGHVYSELQAHGARSVSDIRLMLDADCHWEKLNLPLFDCRRIIQTSRQYRPMWAASDDPQLNQDTAEMPDLIKVLSTTDAGDTPHRSELLDTHRISFKVLQQGLAQLKQRQALERRRWESEWYTFVANTRYILAWAGPSFVTIVSAILIRCRKHSIHHAPANTPPNPNQRRK